MSDGTWGGIDLTAVKVLIAHQRRDIGSCICGWGVDTGDLGRSHALHVWRELQAAGVTRRVTDDHPERPTPVDPATVQVGWVVEVEADDGTWMVRGLVNARDTGQLQIVIGNTRFVWVLVAGANVHVVVRVVSRPDEPDPEQVEALRAVVRDVNLVTWDSSEEYARELYRRGVRAPELDGDQKRDPLGILTNEQRDELHDDLTEMARQRRRAESAARDWPMP